MKTLIGKNNYLFLKNDSCRELEVHCNNLNLVTDKELKRYDFIINKFLLIVFPNKSLIYKDFLPEPYIVKYRPAIEIYKNKFKECLLDTYPLLKDVEDTYYKTDTHMNLKGAYIVYNNFIEKVNNLYDLKLIPKRIDIQCKKCELTQTLRGIGDLTWDTNLGQQHLEDITDTFYYSNDIIDIYCSYQISNKESLRFLTYNLEDETLNLENNNRIVDWDIISNYVLYKKNKNTENKSKILIIYDSFLLNSLYLYLELFHEIYLAKTVYHIEFIEKIKPDYIFEFRLERFLC